MAHRGGDHRLGPGSAVGRADGTVTFWDGERFEQGGDSVAFDERVTGLSFSPDDRTLAVSSGRVAGRAAPTTRTTPQLVDVATRRLTGTSAKYQRKLQVAIKRARFLALLPYATD